MVCVCIYLVYHANHSPVANSIISKGCFTQMFLQLALCVSVQGISEKSIVCLGLLLKLLHMVYWGLSTSAIHAQLIRWQFCSYTYFHAIVRMQLKSYLYSPGACNKFLLHLENSQTIVEKTELRFMTSSGKQRSDLDFIQTSMEV